MKILYICNFNLNNSEGRDRATRQKLAALKKHVTKLDIIHSSFNSKFKLLELILIELKGIFFILKNKPDLLISRGYVGYFTQKIANYRKIKTIREIHADLQGELQQLKKTNIEKLLLIPFVYLNNKIDKNADIRIFNHPKLMDWYKNKIFNCKNDFYVYNGFSEDAKSSLSKVNARNKFLLKNEYRYFVFVGAASYWHGVDYLVSLQLELNKINSNIKIICGGGEIPRELDPKQLLINIYPLNEYECANLISASDACLLPVRDSRISPGSPLKLYDYILHNKFIITQQSVLGYSDEVQKYKFGIEIDFMNPKETAKKLSNLDITEAKYDFINNFSWEERMKKWLNNIENIRI